MNYYLKLLAVILMGLFSVQGMSEIDIETFAQHQKVAEVKIAPDGKHFAARVREKGKYHLAFFETQSLKFIYKHSFRGDEEVGDFHWVNNERVVLSIMTQHGSSDVSTDYGLLYGVNYNGKRKRLLFGYLAGQMQTGMKIRVHREGDRAHAEIIHLLPEDKRKILIGTSPWGIKNNFEATGTVYRMDVYTGVKSRITGFPQIHAHGAADNSGRIRLAAGMSIDYKNELYIKNPKKGWTLLEKGRFSWPVGFSKDNKFAYLLSDHGADVIGLYTLDLETHEKTLLYQHDFADIEAKGVTFNPITKEPISVLTMPDYPQYEFLDKTSAFARLYSGLSASFDGDAISLTSVSDDGKQGIIKTWSDINPGRYYLVEFETNRIKFLIGSTEGLERKQLAQQQPFGIKTRDGLILRGYLTLPNGTQGKNLPMVVLPHGGPHARDFWEYDRDVQLLASRGYAVLQINFRGSTGYGISFRDAGFKNWGTLIQDDIAQATNWAIQKGVADKNRICIFGISFGAYSALMGPIRHPGLYQCAIGQSGAYDLSLMYDTGDIQESTRGNAYLKSSVGKKEELLIEQSPVMRADELTIPVFLAHGKRDERTPFKHAKKMKQTIEAQNRKVEWMEVSGEEHGFANKEVMSEFYRRMLAFLDEHIGQQSAEN